LASSLCNLYEAGVGVKTKFSLSAEALVEVFVLPLFFDMKLNLVVVCRSSVDAARAAINHLFGQYHEVRFALNCSPKP
jgi:hypothetical protein